MREIELKPSRLLGVLLMGASALAFAALALGTLPVAVRLGAAAVVSGVVAWGWWRSRPRDRLRRLGNGHLQVADAAGHWCDVEVQGDSFVSPLLIVLRYRVGRSRVRSLVLLPDSADAADLRRLRVSLRWPPRTRSDTGFPDAG